MPSLQDATEGGSQPRRLQDFLGVTHDALTYTQQPLNTAPTRDMIENYDELREAFKDTPAAAYLD